MRRRVMAGMIVATMSLGVAVGPALAQPDGAVLLSAMPDGTPGEENAFSPVVSADGSTIAFSTGSSNLIPGADLSQAQILVADVATGSLRLVSHTPTGDPSAEGTRPSPQSHSIAISADGSRIAFVSLSPDLVADDTNGSFDVFVWSAATDQVERASLGSGGQEAVNGASTVAMTADGATVVMNTQDGGPFGGDSGITTTVVRDLSTGTTEIVSKAPDGLADLGVNGGADVSADGRYVSYTTDDDRSSDLDDNRENDIYRYDRQTGTVEPMSVAADGTMPGIVEDGYLDASGQRIVFTGGDAFDGGLDTFLGHIVVRDMLAGTTRIIDRLPDGSIAQGQDDAAFAYDMSPDGGFVTFVGPGRLDPDSPDTESGGNFLYELATDSLTALQIEGNPGEAHLSTNADVIGLTYREEDFSTQVYVLRGGAPPPAPPACVGSDADPATTERVDEVTAVRAAVALSCGLFADAGTTGDITAGWVVLSRDDAFADSLAGAPLTSGGPMVFTAPARLDLTTQAEIERVLEPGGTVYLLGGEVALSADVEGQLSTLGFDVVRLAGPSRIETALRVADEVLRRNNTADEVLVARAYNAEGNETSGWADSVTGGGYAAAAGVPIILTPTESLHPATMAWLVGHTGLDRTILGGEAAVSVAAATSIGAHERIAGAERFATNAAILDNRFVDITSNLREGDRTVTIVNGEQPLGWAFGFAAAARSAFLDAPVILSANDGTVRAPVQPFVKTCGDPEVETLLVGGASIIPDSVAAQLDQFDGSACEV